MKASTPDSNATNANSPWADLLGMSLHELIKTDEEYLGMYQKRVTALNNLAAKLHNPEGFVQALEQTAKAHREAIRLGVCISRVEALLLMPLEEKLQRVFHVMDQPVAPHPDFEKAVPGVTEMLRSFRMPEEFLQATMKSRKVLLQLASIPILDEKTFFEQAPGTHIPDENDPDGLYHNTVVENAGRLLISLHTAVSVLELLAELGIIYRGLLYLSLIHI